MNVFFNSKIKPMRIKTLVIIYSLSVCFTSTLFSQNNIKYFRKFSIDLRYYQIELKYPVDKSVVNKMSCYQVKYDDKNRIQTIAFLDRGKLSIDNMKVTKFVVEYSDSLENRFYFDKFDKPTVNREGIHSYSLKKNRNNHPVQMINYDKTDGISEDKNGVSIYQFALDENGRTIKVNFLNRESDSIVDKDNSFYRTYQWTEDKSAYMFVMSNYDKSNRLIENSNGIAITYSKYNKTNKELIEQTYYGADKAIKVSKQYNASMISTKYDLDGNETERKFYGINGKLILSNQGYSMVRPKYNTFGKATEQRLYGNDEKLICGSNKAFIRNGFAIIRYEYDANGNNTKVSYYENDEKLVQDTSKIAIRIYTYDEYNRKTSESLYDANNQLVLKENGCTTNWKYDKFDNIVEEKHYGHDNKLKESKKGIAIIRWNYDAEGKLQTTQYFNSTEKLLSEN